MGGCGSEGRSRDSSGHEERRAADATACRSDCLFPSPTVAFDPKIGKPQLDSPCEHSDAHWYAALEVAGISDFRFHDLRHTTASMLAAQGASLLEIADALGHKTLAMIKRYSHLVVDHKAKAIEPNSPGMATGSDGRESGLFGGETPPPQPPARPPKQARSGGRVAGRFRSGCADALAQRRASNGRCRRRRHR